MIRSFVVVVGDTRPHSTPLVMKSWMVLYFYSVAIVMGLRLVTFGPPELCSL